MLPLEELSPKLLPIVGLVSIVQLKVSLSGSFIVILSEDVPIETPFDPLIIDKSENGTNEIFDTRSISRSGEKSLIGLGEGQRQGQRERQKQREKQKQIMDTGIKPPPITPTPQPQIGGGIVRPPPIIVPPPSGTFKMGNIFSKPNKIYGREFGYTPSLAGILGIVKPVKKPTKAQKLGIGFRPMIIKGGRKL